jgi:tRNA A37 threonylcarbamoyladenosine dehydratase
LSVLGASSRTDPFAIRLASLDDTSVCPLARALRRRLRSRRLPTDIPVLYSTEPPLGPAAGEETDSAEALSESPCIRGRIRRALPSLSPIPGIMGLMAANHCILELLRGTS